MATTRETDLVTVAAIRRGKDKSYQYLFNERQRIFSLRKRSAGADESGRLLKEALDKRIPVKVALDLKRPLIQRVSAPSKRELDEFARTRIPLDKAETDRVVPIDVARIDPTKFNIVDAYLKWRVFRRCTKIIPSYAKAKEIFDFCAAFVPPAGSIRGNALHSVPVRPGRVLCASASDAPDHHDAVPLLL
jgi:hypothetical protein